MAHLLVDRIFSGSTFHERDGAKGRAPVDSLTAGEAALAVQVKAEEVPAHHGIPKSTAVGVFGKGTLTVNVPELGENSPFTIEVLCKPSTKSSRANIIAASRVPVSLFVEKGEVNAAVRDSNGWIATHAKSAGAQWQLLTMVYTGDDLFLFVDHSLVGRRTIDNDLKAVGATGFVLGAWTDKSQWKFDGSIAALRIWSGIATTRVLTAPAYQSQIDSAVHDGQGAIESRHLDRGGNSGPLGPATVTEEAVTRQRGQHKVRERRRSYQHGEIHWSLRTGANAIQGPIADCYRKLGGVPALGLPTTEQIKGERAGVTLAKFESGYIYHCAKTGAHAVTGHLLYRFLDLGGEVGTLGLPTADQSDDNGGISQPFERATLYAVNTSSSAFEVHGAIRDKYIANGATGSGLHFPLSNEETIWRRSGDTTTELGKHNRFQGGVIYWSGATGAHEVRGAILDLYETKGGPSGSLGFPTSDEISAPKGGVRYSNFENGVIVWKQGAGARAFTRLELHVGEVSSGIIDDGIKVFKRDRTAELVTYTTITVNGVAIETRKQRPDHYAGSTYDINATYTIEDVTGETSIRMTISVDDWDKANPDDHLGSINRTFDVSTFWGLLEGSPRGIFINQIADERGNNLLAKDHLQFDFSMSDGVGADPSKHYREQMYWRFDNFSTPTLSRAQYAATFRDVEHTPYTWDAVWSPFDEVFYKAAYKGAAASGNCFGLSLESVMSRAGMSVFPPPIHNHVGTTGDSAQSTPDNVVAGVKDVVNTKHGYQLGASAITWTIASLKSSDAVRPTKVLRQVEYYLSQRDWPVVCMSNWVAGKAHCVVPYKVERGSSGQPDRIYVADPNTVWRQKQGDPSYIEVYSNDTFKFVGGSGAAYEQTSTTEVGSLPATLMICYPLHRLSSIPRTPFWEVMLAVFTLLTGILVLSGDGTADQVNVNGQDLYTRVNGENRLRSGGLSSRIPLFDAGGNAPEMFATIAENAAIATTIRGLRNGEVTQLTAVHDAAVSYCAATRSGTVDKLVLEGTDKRRAVLKAHSDRGNLAAITIAQLDHRSQAARSVSVEVALPKDREVVSGFREGGAFGIYGATSDHPIRINLTTSDGLATRVVTVQPESSDEAILISPESFDATRPEIIIERLSGFGGELLGRIVENG